MQITIKQDQRTSMPGTLPGVGNLPGIGNLPGMSNLRVAKIRQLLYSCACLLLAGACTPKENTIKTVIENPMPVAASGLVYEVNSAPLMQSIAHISDERLVVMDGSDELAYQSIREKGERIALLVEADLLANEKKIIVLKEGNPSNFPPKTQAEISVKKGGEWVWVTKKNGTQQYEYSGGEWEHVNSLRVDKKHTDHSFDIRYEGPGWESDKIGFRFYLDWRNANDIFGKKTDRLVLQNIGLDGFDSYHEIADWGVDILKVAESLGIGSVGHWDGSMANRVAKTDSIYSEVTYKGKLESKITTKYFGWEHAGGKTDLTSELLIRAGSYMTRANLETPNPIDNFCTGIIKMKDTSVLSSMIQSPETEGEWAYMATFGKQSLENDNMGLFIFFRKKDLIEQTEDKLNHVVILKPGNNKLTYYFGGVWEQDASGIDTIEKLEAFLTQQLALLNL